MQYCAARQVKERGFRLILSDGNPMAYCRTIADEFIVLDTFDTVGHLAIASDLELKYDILGVFTVASDCHGTVNAVARQLDLHHLPVTISDICRDKAATRAVLTQAGLLQPTYRLCHSYQEALEFVASSNMDMVVKATDSSGSRGFSVVKKGDKLQQSNYEEAFLYGTKGAIVIEQKLTPDRKQISEASVETLWIDGKMYWINWVDRLFSNDLRLFPNLKIGHTPLDGVEVGHINPAFREPRVKDQVFNEIVQAGNALGISSLLGAYILKADIFFSDQGPVILELTPRISGGWDSSGTSIERGANIAGGIIHSCLGEAIGLDEWDKYFSFRYPEITSVAVAGVAIGAKNCIGREFAIASGCASATELLNRALNKLQDGDLYVPVH